MKTLFLAPRLPYPADTGGKIRTLYLLSALARSEEVHLLSFGEEGEEAEAIRAKVRSLTLVPPPPTGFWSDLGRLWRGLFKGAPVAVLRYASQEMSQALAQLTRAHRFDWAHIDHAHMAQYLPELGDIPASIDEHNVESHLFLRLAKSVRGARRALLWQQAALWHRFEAGVLCHAKRATACSVKDAERLRRLAPDTDVAVIPNGVDVERFSQTGPRMSDGHLVFVGSMDWEPNVQGAVWFCQKVLPRLRVFWPEVRVFLVGRSPDERVCALARLPGVVVTGSVPDVRPYLRGALATIVPLLVGGGTRLKILESFAAGIPVVSTRVGCEGIDARCGEHLLVADEPEVFALSILKLKRNPDYARSLAEAASHLVRERYSWESIGRALVARYQRQRGALQEAG